MKTADLFDKALKYLDCKNIPSLVDKGYIARWMTDFAVEVVNKSEAQPSDEDLKNEIINYLNKTNIPDLGLMGQAFNCCMEIAKAMRDGKIKSSLPPAKEVMTDGDGFHALELLIEDYHRRIVTLNKEKQEDIGSMTYSRLETKGSCYKYFIIELERVRDLMTSKK